MGIEAICEKLQMRMSLSIGMLRSLGAVKSHIEEHISIYIGEADMGQ